MAVNLILLIMFNTLVFYIDKFLPWDCHITQLLNKLSRVNGILSKLRHFTKKETLLSVYYAIFYSHTTYGCLVWSFTSSETMDSITVLQKKMLTYFKLCFMVS